jgi:hypothetical protein
MGNVLNFNPLYFNRLHLTILNNAIENMVSGVGQDSFTLQIK